MKCEKCKKREAFHVHHKDGNHEHNDPKNLQSLCVLCHSEIHDNEAKWTPIKVLYKFRRDLIEERVALDNRVRNLKQYELDLSVFNEVSDILIGKIKAIEKRIKQLVRQEPIWEWLSKVTGVAEVNAGGLIAKLNPIENFSTVSKVWAFMGLRPQGEDESDKDYIKYRQSTKDVRCLAAYDIGEQFVKQTKSFYRSIYDSAKRKYEKREDWTQGRRHRAAIRIAAKMFLCHLWVIWRQLEGLSTRSTYVNGQLGHESFINPPHIPERLRPFKAF